MYFGLLLLYQLDSRVALLLYRAVVYLCTGIQILVRYRLFQEDIVATLYSEVAIRNLRTERQIVLCDGTLEEQSVSDFGELRVTAGSARGIYDLCTYRAIFLFHCERHVDSIATGISHARILNLRTDSDIFGARTSLQEIDICALLDTIGTIVLIRSGESPTYARRSSEGLAFDSRKDDILETCVFEIAIREDFIAIGLFSGSESGVISEGTDTT